MNLNYHSLVVTCNLKPVLSKKKQEC